MILATNDIQFLGMKISQGTCTPEMHIGQSISDFPEENLSKHQVQQFLGVINYVREFLLEAAKLINPLNQMLKKKPPDWGMCENP